MNAGRRQPEGGNWSTPVNKKDRSESVFASRVLTGYDAAVPEYSVEGAS